MEVKNAVDVIRRCVRDMDDVFRNQTFEDIYIATDIVDRVIELYDVDVEVSVNVNGRRRDEDDHYDYIISVPEADAFAHIYITPPTVYDPYESHDEDEDYENIVRMEWLDRRVHVKTEFGMLHFSENGKIHGNVTSPKTIDRDYIAAIQEAFGVPITLYDNSSRRSSRRLKNILVL